MRLGVYGRIVGDRILIDAMIADIEGKDLVRCVNSSPVNQSKVCAQKLAPELLEGGGREVLHRIRDSGNAFDHLGNE